MSETEQVNILIFDSHPTRISGYERCLIDLGTNLIKAGSPSEALSAMLKTNIAIALIGGQLLLLRFGQTGAQTRHFGF